MALNELFAILLSLALLLSLSEQSLHRLSTTQALFFAARSDAVGKSASTSMTTYLATLKHQEVSSKTSPWQLSRQSVGPLAQLSVTQKPKHFLTDSWLLSQVLFSQSTDQLWIPNFQP